MKNKNQLLSCVIIDDESDSINFISSILDEYCTNIEIVGKAQSVKEGIQIIRKTNPKLVLLDVEMPDGTGFNLLEKITDRNFQVIFITAYNHYAIKAIKFSALDYVLKPINIKELLYAINKAIELPEQNQTIDHYYQTLIENLKSPKPSKIGLTLSDGIEFIETDSIIRIKAEGSYSNLYLTEARSILISKNLGEFQELLVESSFFRPHHSHLINLKWVKKYVKSDGGYIIMKNNEHVPLSKSKKEGFIQLMSSISKF